MPVEVGARRRLSATLVDGVNVHTRRVPPEAFEDERVDQQV
jgi:hypothetical protein